jgi:hypothetical protein
MAKKEDANLSVSSKEQYLKASTDVPFEGGPPQEDWQAALSLFPRAEASANLTDPIMRSVQAEAEAPQPGFLESLLPGLRIFAPIAVGVTLFVGALQFWGAPAKIAPMKAHASTEVEEMLFAEHDDDDDNNEMDGLILQKS